jgi:hypothetical protein
MHFSAPQALHINFIPFSRLAPFRIGQARKYSCKHIGWHLKDKPGFSGFTPMFCFEVPFSRPKMSETHFRLAYSCPVLNQNLNMPGPDVKNPMIYLGHIPQMS